MVFFLIHLTVFAQQRPLLTDDVDITPSGSLQISAGVDFTQNEKFPLSGLKGDLTRVGNINVRLGVNSNVEIEVEGTLQNYLSVNSRSTSAIPLNIANNSSNDFGDFIVSTKIKLLSETKRRPSIATKTSIQLPNSDQSRGIGTNQINYFGKLIIGKHFGKTYSNKQRQVNVFGNIGIGLMTAPTQLFTQNDIFLYGLGSVVRVNKNINIVGDISGRQNTRKVTPLGTESLSQLRFGTQIKTSGLRFDTAAIIGLSKFSPRSGITFGVTYTSPSIFKPAH